MTVAPLVGARIEIIGYMQIYEECHVAPLVGARIEIKNCIVSQDYRNVSLPSWERGLKFPAWLLDTINKEVAPLVGARIEIALGSTYIL